MKSFSESYKAAGVDITAGYAAVELMKQHVARTMTPGAIGGLGGFGGLFELDMTGLTHPVLVSGTDGVGTKLKIAFLMDKHDTVGIDCVAMCVNDVITCGAKPLVFLDYIACGKNYPEKIASIVAGVAEGCVQAGAALVGGETAEMPGFYPEQEYDLAGFTVGVVEKSKIIDNTKMQAGDAVIALPSSGVHSNGFSLVRKIFNVEYADIWQHYDELSGTLGETLLTPTKIYVKPVLALMEQVDVRAVSHITGGGFYENIPRALAQLTEELDAADGPAAPRKEEKDMDHLSLAAELAVNTYPGRGIVLGRSEDGKSAVIAYFIMGRSANSRNRVFTAKDGGIITEAADPSKLEDPSLIIYAPVRVLGKTTIVTNGDQTDTIYDHLAAGKGFAKALRTRTFEPDSPNFTPRISGIVKVKDGAMKYKLSILKSDGGNADSVERFFFEYDQPVAGEGRFIHTYRCDGSPIPSFAGEPERVRLMGDIDTFTRMVWNSLNEDNKVSLFVRYIDLATGKTQDRIVNKYEKV